MNTRTWGEPSMNTRPWGGHSMNTRPRWPQTGRMQVTGHNLKRDILQTRTCSQDSLIQMKTKIMAQQVPLQKATLR